LEPTAIGAPVASKRGVAGWAANAGGAKPITSPIAKMVIGSNHSLRIFITFLLGLNEELIFLYVLRAHYYQ
jgi:hypothetical protein